MAAELAFDLVIEELKKGAEPLTRTTVRQKIDQVASFFHRSYIEMEIFEELITRHEIHSKYETVRRMQFFFNITMPFT